MLPDLAREESMNHHAHSNLTNAHQCVAPIPKDSPIPALASALNWIPAGYYPSRGRPYPALWGKFPPHVQLLQKHGGRFDTRGRSMRFKDWGQVEAALMGVHALMESTAR